MAERKHRSPSPYAWRVVISVEDAADPRLADYVGLRDVDLRKSMEGRRGLFLAEGEKVIRRAVAAGYPIRSVLTTAKWLDQLADVIDGATVYVVSDAVMEKIAGFKVHRGALASMERRKLPSVSEILASPIQAAPGRPTTPRRILVLEDLVDHGNVGAVFRCAAALGVDAVILSPRCADPLYRRSVKVSMGAVFAVPYARMADWHGGLAEIRTAGFRLLAPTPDQSAVPLDRVTLGDRVALMLGSEGDGLSSHWLHEADQAVCIPMSPAAMALGVDSLNVVAAAAIACHDLIR
jgi:tRNA G18 (ribose-2'-O)-methylase SpoU